MANLHPGRILFEDEHLLVVNKIAGELVVSAGGHGKLPLFDFLQKTYPTLRVVHRLDFGTSGVIVFAKSATAARAIREKKFAGWIKTYQTLVAGQMKNRQGTIDHKLPARTKEELVPAISHYKVLEVFPFATFVEVQIETGRKHQIRQHLKLIGHPLLLDPIYGDPKLDRGFKKHHHYNRFFLHAASLVMPHPITGKTLTLTAELSPSFEKVLGELRKRG